MSSTSTMHASENLTQLIKNGLSDEEIQKTLSSKYEDEYHVINLMKEVKKLRSAQKTSSGLVFVFIGAVLLLLSCVLTLTGTYSQGSFGMVLFGFTTIGVSIVFWGLVKIFS